MLSENLLGQTQTYYSDGQKITVKVIDFVNEHTARVIVSFYTPEGTVRSKAHMKMMAGELADAGFEV